MAQSDAKFQSQTKPWIVRDQCRQNCMQISPGLQLCVRNWPHQKGKEKAGIKKKERMETKETLHVEGDQLEDLGQDLGEVQELATGALQSRVGKP